MTSHASIINTLDSAHRMQQTAIEDIANQLAWDLQKELKPRASNFEREQLQQAIEDFLR